MNILRLPGPNALSDFRREALLQRCRQIDPRRPGARGEPFLPGSLGGRGPLPPKKPLSSATPPGPTAPTLNTTTPSADASICIAPRPGTISPWSTKATDILRNCGLTSVARIERGTEYRILADGPFSPAPLLPLLHDRMTEAVLQDDDTLFSEVAPRPLQRVPLAQGAAALERANGEMGLGLPDDEIRYLFDAFAALRRDPTDVELVMFANVNSEHCRHKIFNADWTIDGARARAHPVRHDPQHPRALPAKDGEGLRRQRRGHRGLADAVVRLRFGPALRLRVSRRAQPHPLQGGDPQPPDRNLPLPGGLDRGRRRDSRRGGDRHRRPVPGRALRLLHLPPAHPRIRAALGARLRRVPGSAWRRRCRS